MKHKNILHKAKFLGMAAAFLCSGGVLTSCLDVQPQNEIILEQFWNEQKDGENIVAGCYSGMQTYGMISRMLIWGEFRSENVVNNGTITDDVDLERLLKENITASNGYTNWAEFYSIINRCNTVIKYAPEVAEKDPAYNESQLNAHIAEVTALRSLCYFYLIRAFRDVPYSETAFLDDSQTLDLPATKFDVILDNLINSLKDVEGKAIKKYPEKNTTAYWDYNCNRVTQSLIHAMLCELYLWKQDYAQCRHYADLIIKQKTDDALLKHQKSEFTDFYNYPLVSSRYKGMNMYGNAFNAIFIENNSMESIFELNFRKDDTNGALMCNGPACFFYGGGTRTPFVKATSFVANDERDKLYNVYSKYNEGYDSRAYENIMFAAKSPVGIYKYAGRGQVAITDAEKASEATSYGSLWPTYDNDKQSRNKSNFMIYRLTDIMLLKAEALALSISTDATIDDQTSEDYKLLSEAFELVDAVNKRSLMVSSYDKHVLSIKDFNTKQAMLNLVYDERQRELMFEGKRYFDLVRRAMRENNTDYLTNHVTNKDPQTASVVKSKMTQLDAIFWPYNLYELKVNHNLKQNPAFGSGEDSSFQK